MNTDSYTYAGIKIAKYNENNLVYLLPKQNQDYALCGEDRIILCDGCSSSPNTDIGARLLALSADRMNWKDTLDPIIFGKIIINDVNEITSNKIPLETFDSTLLVANYDDGKVHIFIYGDGYVVHKNKLRTTTYQIKNSANAPAYLSYHLDDERKSNYLGMNTTNTVTRFIHSHNENGEMGGIDSKVYLDVFEPFAFTLKVQKEDEVYLMSDGIESFRYEIDENKTQINDELSQGRLMISNLIENEILKFKNRKGCFIQRRCNRLIKHLYKEAIHPYDDVTVIGMII